MQRLRAEKRAAPQQTSERAAFSSDQLAALAGKPGLKAQADLAASVREKTSEALVLLKSEDIEEEDVVSAMKLIDEGEQCRGRRLKDARQTPQGCQTADGSLGSPDGQTSRPYW